MEQDVSMSRRAIIALAGAVLVALGATAGGVYAYDRAQADRVAHGVFVGGVDIGGLEAEAARAKLRAQMLPRLAEPLTVVYRRTRFELTASEARVNADMDAAVHAALARSRDGDLVARTWRSLTSDELGVAIPLSVTYSREAVTAFVHRVRDAIGRHPREAKVSATATRVRIVQSRPGRRVQPIALTRMIVRSLTDPRAGRVVRVPTEVRRPTLTTAELGKKYPWFITISRSEKRLRLYRRLRPFKTYVIAVGRAGYETPAGLHRVETKAINPAWEAPEWAGVYAGRVIPGGVPENPLKERWLGIYDGAGIHGTDDIGSLGTAASHGCIRMSIPEVIELYKLVPLRTPVYIA
jgi:lipoprotein-anchoring transpeptidase ErfK/SrfK